MLAPTQRRCQAGLSKAQIASLLSEVEHQCAYCEKSLKNRAYEIDHIVPLSFGGSNLVDNLVICCHRCNSMAHNLIFNSFQAKRLYILDKI